MTSISQETSASGCARLCGFCRLCEAWAAEKLSRINAVIEANPGTDYAYRPATLKDERQRMYRYARMVALETLRTLERAS